MNTTLLDPPAEEIIPLTHTKVVGDTRWWCVQPDCDGEHHFYCDRQHANVA